MPVKKKDHSGTMVGAGTTLGTVGLVGGGLPGTKSRANLADVKTASGRKEKAKIAGKAYGAGEFGYRHNAHHVFDTFTLKPKAKGTENPTRKQAFRQGEFAGRSASETDIIRHLNIGRKASNVALAGGAALVGAGAYQHSKRKGVHKAAKRDHFKADAITAGGASTAVLGGGVSTLLDRQGKKWSKRSAASLHQAMKMNPKAGGYTIQPSKHRVPDVKPEKSTGVLASERNKIFAGRSKEHAAKVGALHGSAGQERYFAKTYGDMAKISRKVGVAGVGIAAAGVAGKHGYEINRNKSHVKKNLAMAKGARIPGVAAITDHRGSIHFLSELPKLQQGNPQRVLNTTRRPKRKLMRTGPRQLPSTTGAVSKSFMEMPGTLINDDSTRTESLTAVRTRDLKSGRFVGAPTLVAKKLNMTTSVKRIMEGTTAGVIGGVAANQFPQNQRSTKKLLKKMDPETTVTLKKKDRR
jgi:hypothetical protein